MGEQEEEHIELTDRQRMFIEHYCHLMNATQAAIRAGYSKHTARQTGYEILAKPHIRKEVNKRLSELILGPEETTKLVSDIAKGNLNDFLIIRKEEYTPKVKKHLSELIKELEEEIKFEEEFAKRAKLRDKKKENHQARQMTRQLQLVRYQMELERNPDATKIVSGPTELINVVQVDMAKLAKYKELGRIKSITETKYGPKIELYAADGALRDLMRVHGLYEKDNSQQAIPDIIVLKPTE